MKFAVSYSTPYYGVDPDRIVGATATESDQQRDELSAFAERFGLLGRSPRRR